MEQQLFDLVNRSKELNSIHKVSETILGFTHTSRDHELSKIFVDYSDSSLDQTDEALNRQKTAVERDFFETEGALQWNFYYYYLVQPDDLKKYQDSGTIRKIETDGNYTRKRVVTLQQLQTHYPFQSILTTDHTSTSVTDLSSEWISVLKSYQLDEVYSEDSTFEKGMSNYLEGQPVISDEGFSNSDPSSQVSTPRGIKTLSLTKFRKHKPNSVFDLKKVNLIEGINGAGKTSLLEAIELLMCGRSLRQDELPPEQGIDISLKFTGAEEIEKYDPTNAKKFKQRDLFWYGTPPAHSKAALHKSFGRFNFFNTDAAYRFSTETESEEIWKSFESLALGARATELAKRMSKFEELFGAEERRLQKTVIALTDEIKREESDFSKLGGITTQLSMDLQRLESVIRSYGKDPNLKITDLSAVERAKEKMVSSRTWLSFVDSAFKALKELSLNSINQEKQSIVASEQALTAYDQARVKLQSSYDTKIRNGLNISQDKKKRMRLLEYWNNTAIAELPKLALEIAELSARKSKLEIALSSLGAADLLPAMDDNAQFSALLASLEADLKLKTKVRTDLDTKLKAAKTAVESVQSLLLEIKSLGRKFLSVSQTTKCPLCESEHTREELEKKIAAVNLGTLDLSKMLDDRLKIETDARQIETALQSVRRILNTTKAIGGDTSTLGAAKTFINGIHVQVQEVSHLIMVKTKTLAAVTEQGLSAAEYSELMTELGVNSDADLANLKIAFGQFTARQEEQLKALRKEATDLQQDLKKLDEDVLKQIEKFGVFSSVAEWKESHTRRTGNYNSAFANLERVLNGIAVDPTANLRSVLSDLDESIAQVTEYMVYAAGTEKNRLATSQLQQKIEGKRKQLGELNNRLERAKLAAQAFHKINNEYGKETAVRRFFDRNKSIILTIFKAIHTPSEFDDLELGTSEILVKSGDTSRRLNQISTGQRAALAISVFLGMHLSCARAPSLLIFDDPVAFIDDLNVLSFLDFLRDISLHKDTQIFFATANRKVASLFRRKFEVLGESFNPIALER